MMLGRFKYLYDSGNLLLHAMHLLQLCTVKLMCMAQRTRLDATRLCRSIGVALTVTATLLLIIQHQGSLHVAGRRGAAEGRDL